MNITAIPSSVNKGVSQLALFGVITLVVKYVLETALKYTVGRVAILWCLMMLGYYISEILTINNFDRYHWFSVLATALLCTKALHCIVLGYRGSVDSSTILKKLLKPVWGNQYGILCMIILSLGMLSTTAFTIQRPGMSSAAHVDAEARYHKAQSLKSIAYIAELGEKLSQEQDPERQSWLLSEILAEKEICRYHEVHSNK